MRRARGEPRRDLVLVDELSENSRRRGEGQSDVAEERHLRGLFAPERLRVVGDMQDRDALGHRLGVVIGVSDKRSSADKDNRLRRLEVGAHVGEIGL